MTKKLNSKRNIHILIYLSLFIALAIVISFTISFSLLIKKLITGLTTPSSFSLFTLSIFSTLLFVFYSSLWCLTEFINSRICAIEKDDLKIKNCKEEMCIVVGCHAVTYLSVFVNLGLSISWAILAYYINTKSIMVDNKYTVLILVLSLISSVCVVIPLIIIFIINAECSHDSSTNIDEIKAPEEIKNKSESLAVN